MEAGASDLEKEEKYSTRVAKKEDLIALQMEKREQEEKERRRRQKEALMREKRR
ncbi:hypothetical protein PLEOSDRAFT_1090467 [Pleurotus ostreatus PC15]|nr:hypothetical protein PLEOSDRAFT_1090467 [Pleurotus ostreatus PC15]